MVGIVSQLHQIPNLQELRIECRRQRCNDPRPKNVTVPFKQSLAASRHPYKLQKLALSNLILDVKVLRQFLLNLPCLTNLRLRRVNPWTYKETVACVVHHLEHHSSTIIACDLIDDLGTFDRSIFEDLMKIKYYVALNQDGKRARVQKSETTLSQFVVMLSDAITDRGEASVVGILESRGGNYVHNLQYGLLKAKPHLWSSP